jgi:hypothetical protein
MSLHLDDGQSQYPKTEQPYNPAIPQSYSYGLDGSEAQPASRSSIFDPRGWRRRTQIIAGVVLVVVIIAVIVGAYEGWKANRYPSYSALNYSIKDTFEGENFFDNFYYWSTADPTSGFVV